MALYLGETQIFGVATGDAAGSGSADIPTCTVRFVSGENISTNGCTYTKCVDGIISSEHIADTYTQSTNTFENVVCGSFLYFNWVVNNFLYIGSAGYDSSQGGDQIMVDGVYIESPYFKAPTEPGITWTVTLSANSG